MPNRSLRSYLGLPKRARASVRYSQRSAQGMEREAGLGSFQPIKDFFDYDVFAWFIHTWRVMPPFPYPQSLNGSIHDIGGEEGEQPLLLALAADWATDTEQSEYIGRRIYEKSPDLTIHMGDTYYSGTASEMKGNFGGGNGDHGLWPRGSLGSFALSGNHEMYSSGTAYLDMIKDANRGFGMIDRITKQFSGQPAPCFCLRTPYWLILGLDTGYESLKTGILQFHPDNIGLRFPEEVMSWLRNEVLDSPEKRGVIVLTHHQYVTAFHEESEFTGPSQQLRSLLPDSEGILWIWGHEHRFAMYGKNRLGDDHIPAYGRCIGNGGMPDEHTSGRYVIPPQADTRNLVLFDARTADCFPHGGLFGPRSLGIGYNGYALLRLHRQEAEITYYESYKNDNGTDPGRDEPVIRERWIADIDSGQIRCTLAEDLTTHNPEGDRLSYHGQLDPTRIGR